MKIVKKPRGKHINAELNIEGRKRKQVKEETWRRNGLNVRWLSECIEERRIQSRF